MSSMIMKGLVIATAIDNENTNFIRTCIEAPLEAQNEFSSCVMTDHTSGFCSPGHFTVTWCSDALYHRHLRPDMGITWDLGLQDGGMESSIKNLGEGLVYMLPCLLRLQFPVPAHQDNLRKMCASTPTTTLAVGKIGSV